MALKTTSQYEFSGISKVLISEFSNLSIKPEPPYHTKRMPYPEQTPGCSSDYHDHPENYN